MLKVLENINAVRDLLARLDEPIALTIVEEVLIDVVHELLAAVEVLNEHRHVYQTDSGPASVGLPYPS